MLLELKKHGKSLKDFELHWLKVAGYWPRSLKISATSGSMPLLGATVQVQHNCSVCGTTTERLRHCGSKTKQARGLGWISNDIVNAVCTLLGCVVSAIIFLAIG